jgi:hypothetical protein
MAQRQREAGGSAEPGETTEEKDQANWVTERRIRELNRPDPMPMLQMDN